ncbi:MAG: hypothetical protein MHMPM18_003840 [Marteilia pararefringens]
MPIFFKGKIMKNSKLRILDQNIDKFKHKQYCLSKSTYNMEKNDVERGQMLKNLLKTCRTQIDTLKSKGSVFEMSDVVIE